MNTRLTPTSDPNFITLLAFLKCLGKPEPWVAIDDEPLHYPASVNVILTDPAKGFDEEAAGRLRESLG